MAGRIAQFRLFSELLPPRGADISQTVIEGMSLVDAGAEALFIPDAPGGQPRLDSVMAAALLQRELNVPCIPHLNCRDRNRVALKGALWAAKAAGLFGVKVVTGDPLPGGGVSGTWDEDSISLTRMASEEVGLDVVIGHRLGGPGSVDSQDRFLDKVRAGASVAITTPLLDPELAVRVAEACIAAGVRPVIALVAVPSVEVLHYLDQEVNSFRGSPDAAARLRQAADPALEGVAIACEVAERVGDRAGFHVALPFGRAKAGVALLRELRRLGVSRGH
ncbi:MAG: hypothetical protein EXS14_02750 [Planctomycetes bacterium]|nr:hypothetical protein [Planctomycetota bacterium]